MELKETIIFLKHYIRFILAVSIAGGLLSGLLAVAWPQSFRATVNIYVQRLPEKVAGVYSYDGYYAGQAAENYTDTVKGLVVTLDIIKRAAEISDLSTDADFIKQLSRKIKVTKTAPRLVEVAVNLGNREQAKMLVLGLAQSASERAKLLNQEGDKDLIINVVNPDPLIEKSVFNPYLFSLVGALAGLLLALSFVCFRDYLKNPNT